MRWKIRWRELQGMYIAYKIQGKLCFDRVDLVSDTGSPSHLAICLSIGGSLVVDKQSYLDIWVYTSLQELLDRYYSNKRAIIFAEDLIMKGLDTL